MPIKVTMSQFSTLLSLETGGDFYLDEENEQTLVLTVPAFGETVLIEPDGSYTVQGGQEYLL